MRTIRNLAVAAALLASPAMAQPVTILALGDSLTQGFGLPAEDGFVPQLQRWLDANGANATLINAGVSGDTTAGGLSRIDWALTPDIDAVILALGGNDVLRGTDPYVVRNNVDTMLGIATAKNLPILLVGTQAPLNYGPAYKATFDALYPELAKQYQTLFHPNLLTPLLAIEDRAAAIRQFMQSDGLHPNAEGVRLIVEAIGPSVIELIALASDN